MLKKMMHEANLKARCRELGVPIWLCPQFIFLVVGTIVVAVLLMARFLTLRYLDPDLSFLIILGLSIFLLVVTFIIVRAFEKVLEAKQSEAKQSKEVLALKDQFVFIAAHELRTPVNAIKWATELISAKHAETDESSRDLFDILNKSADRLLALVKDLLEVARIESKAIQFAFASCSVNEICASISAEFKGSVSAQRKKIVCKIPANIPEVKADPGHLKEVFDNLIGNAIKFSPTSSEIEVDAKWDNKHVIISIKDEGIGISKQDAPHVFEKFWRSDRSRKTSGTGLGLFITKYLMEQMEGIIWFQSNVGSSGTTFFIKLLRSDIAVQ
jgi:signal transduction histidine kinase